jgi:uncharacterized membrane protein (Fun14 family)
VKVLNLDQNLAVTLGGGFFGGILIGYALKKIIKIVAIIAGFFLAALAPRAFSSWLPSSSRS